MKDDINPSLSMISFTNCLARWEAYSIVGKGLHCCTLQARMQCCKRRRLEGGRMAAIRASVKETGELGPADVGHEVGAAACQQLATTGWTCRRLNFGYRYPMHSTTELACGSHVPSIDQLTYPVQV